MIRSFFLLAATWVISNVLSCHSFAYIYRVAGYEDPQTKQAVAVMSDIHNLGDARQNIQQFELFEHWIVRKAEAKHIPLMILNEDLFSFSLQESELSSFPEYRRTEDGHITFDHLHSTPFEKDYEIELKLANRYQSKEPTWIGGQFTYDMSQRHSLDSIVKIKSIDPRIATHLWLGPIQTTSLRELIELTQLDHYFQNEKYQRLYQTNPALRKEVDKFGAWLRMDHERLVSRVYTAPDSDLKVLYQTSNKEILTDPMGSEISVLSVKNILSFLQNDPNFLSSSVDLVALFEIFKAHQENRGAVVLVGGAHGVSIEDSLKNLGFIKRWETKDIHGVSRQISEMMKLSQNYFEGHLSEDEFDDKINQFDFDLFEFEVGWEDALEVERGIRLASEMLVPVAQ